jgi:hypothetical protein
VASTVRLQCHIRLAGRKIANGGNFPTLHDNLVKKAVIWATIAQPTGSHITR